MNGGRRSGLRQLPMLYLSFFKIAALVVGGGLAMIPVMEETFVRRRKLLAEDELLDMVAVNQMVPGIVAANSAVFVGSKVAGFPGALAAVLGAATPSFLAILAIAMFFPTLDPANRFLVGAFAGVRAAICGLIIVTVTRMARRCHGVFAISFACLMFLLAMCGAGAVAIILISMPAGCAAFALAGHREGSKTK